VIVTGKVFVSCGQRPPEERRVADEVKRLLATEFCLDPYVATSEQRVDDIMAITNEAAYARQSGASKCCVQNRNAEVRSLRL
jgi:hypothetical protein